MTDIPRIKANVGLMIDKGASEDEIDTYLQSEGVGSQDLGGAPQRPDALRSAPPLPQAPPSVMGAIGETAGSFMDGIMPGANRTLAGVGGAIGNTIAAGIGNAEFHPGQAYTEEADAADASQDQFEQDHPNIAGAAGWAGLGAGFALPGLNVARGAGLGAHVLNGAATGGAYGALGGALNDSGDGRLSNAVNGSVVGGALGAAAAPLMGAVSNVGSAARRNIPGVDAAASFLESIPSRFRGQEAPPSTRAAYAQADRMLADQMDGTRNINQGMGVGNVPSTPDNVADEVARRQGMGVPAMPADVSEDLRQTTAWALQGRGTMATRARQALAGRQARSGDRVRGHITDELGPAVDPIREVQEIHRRASAASEPGYRAAYAQPMLVTPEIEEIMRTPAFRNALPQAFENIRNGLGDPTRLGFRIIPDTPGALPPNAPHFRAADGSLVVVDPNLLSFEAMDQIARAMRDSGQAAMDKSGFQARNTTNSVHINNRERDLRRHLGDQNEPYREVTANYADEMALKDGMNNGLEVAKLSGPEIEAQRRAMPQHAQESWMAGARTAIADTATDKSLKPTANVAQQVRQRLGLSGAGSYASRGDSAKLQAIEAMSGRPGVMNRLDDRLEGEDQAYKTFAEASLGSKTQPRQAVDEALSGDALTLTQHVVTGNIAGAVSSVLFRGNPRGTLRFKRDVQDRIAEVMTATRPRDVQTLLREVAARAEADQAFRASLARAGISVGKVASMAAAAQDTDPVDLELENGEVLLGFTNDETTGYQDAPTYGKPGTDF